MTFLLPLLSPLAELTIVLPSVDHRRLSPTASAEALRPGH